METNIVHDCKEYREMIRDGAIHAADYTSEDDLLASKRFIEVLESPAKYFPCTLSLLADPTVPTSDKHAAVMAMQKSGLELFLHLVNYLLVLRQEGLVEFEVVRVAFDAPALWADGLIFDYDDPRVHAAFEAYLQLPEVNDSEKDGVRNVVLSGKAAKNIREQREIHAETRERLKKYQPQSKK